VKGEQKVSKIITNKHEKILNDLLKNKSNKHQGERLFYASGKWLFDAFINNKKLILENNKINLKEILQEDKFNKLKNYNRRTINDDGTIDETFEERIINLLAKSIEDEISTKLNTRVIDYKNARVLTEKEIEEKGLDDDYDWIEDIDNKTDFTSLKLNLFYNNNLRYTYKELPAEEINHTSNLQGAELFIEGSGGVLEFPTKYRLVCTHQDKTGIECGNIVRFCDVHKASTIYCTDSSKDIPGERHTIKKVEKAELKESVPLYYYTGKDNKKNIEDNEDNTINIYSLIPITKELVKANVIKLYNSDTKSYDVLILAMKEEEYMNKLEEPILIKDKKNGMFLLDIYESVKKYYKEQHDIIITDQNKYIGLIYINQLLNKIFFDIRHHSMVIGGSGTGKTYFSKYFIPLFTFKYKNVLGSNITRNKFLGGQSSMRSIADRSLFEPGYVATQDVIFAEESTSSLEKYHLAQTGSGGVLNNLFDMLKNIDNPFDVGIQGSRTVIPKAIVMLVGNTEQLVTHTENYKKAVRNRYKRYSYNDERNSMKHFKDNWALFKPIEYYINVMGNEALAKAHAYVRKNLVRGYYATGLPEAEQSRFTYLVVLEDDKKGRMKRPYKGKTKNNGDLTKNLHRKELYEELAQIFENKEIPDELDREIYERFEEEYLNERNNYIKVKGNDINSHMYERMLEVSKQLVFMNKLYWDLPMTFTEEDKTMLKYFHSFNYNTLSNKESSMIKHPFINDYNVEEVKEIEDYNLEVNEEFRKKQLLEISKQLSEETVKGGDVFGTPE